MEKIAIVTDSTAGLTDQQVTEMDNVYVVPISVTINGHSYQEGIDITNEDFYSQLSHLSKLPTTAPPTPQQMILKYDELVAKGYTKIISIHLTAGITGFVNNLKMATDNYDKAEVTVYDSYITVEPMGYLVRYASLLANQGKSVATITDKVSEIRSSFDEYFVVDDLKNLVHGGRLTNAAAFAGGILKIKPVLSLNENHQIVAVDKIRTMKKAKKDIESKFAAAYQASEFPLHVMVTGTNNLAAVEEWQSDLANKYPNASYQIGQIGPVVGTHLGSNAFVLFWGKQVSQLN
ncbi:DegV family protein [Lentilactobacillus sp. Marseille-Q4993]|uniref:DegV family protein n=1 Tax=Lentilactobacillus sp. Marseille-Q4993 TaxID=3039492 RepID=UPI0024BC4E11|nr:DegV family protein [Lentilactobacillus sp. Marseille-Q4993]